ncbi:hypothetical protein DSO57_1022065 [Entomophthora muscae]|uniref:Uncharacterized protein n=1 Tax=Entomophthora muscae TaxID=34485 RepID=A0ACC2RU81_9FUNG|nr:hypothetical protein DSO57_1022065 [Entomophthora muscae]
MISLSNIEIVLGGLVLAYVAFNVTWLFNEKSGPPRVPYYVPFLGHTYQLRSRAAEFLDECRAKYGNVFTLNFAGEQVIVFSGEEAREMVKMQDVLVAESHNKMMFVSDAVGGWQGAMGLPEHQLDAATVVKSNVSNLLKDVLPDVLAQIEKSIDEQLGTLEDPIAVDAHAFFSEIVVSTVAILLVGHKLAKNKDLKRIMATYFSEVEGMMRLGLKWKSFPLIGNQIAQATIRSTTPSIRIRQEIKTIIKPVFHERQPNSSPATNLLESLIDDGSDIDAAAHLLMVLIFAAISTTTNTCLNLLGDLLAFPKFFGRLKQEQEQVVKDGEVVTKDHLEQMEHLNSAIRETLRHRAHRIGQWRITCKPHVLRNGLGIPKGSLLALDATSLHFNEAAYSSANEYDPFRFVGTGLNATRVNSSFIGFGSGRHACPGRFFAVQEVTSIMSTLLRKCNFATEDGKPGQFKAKDTYVRNYKVVLSKSTV